MISLTPIILTFNEEANIGRTLGALRWANEVIIIDSGSTDRTIEIAKAEHPNVQVVQRSFDSFAGQCNFGLSKIETEWVLSLDADYELSPQLSAEIQALDATDELSGFSVEFEYRIYGHALRASVYPRRTVLYRRDCARYKEEGHAHRVVVGGLIGRLVGKIYHDDRKPLSRWIQEQDRYAKLEAKHLLRSRSSELGVRSSEDGSAYAQGYGATRPAAAGEKDRTELSVQDRLRLKIFFAAPAMFFYLLFGRGLILDGWPGWFYVAQRTIAELLLSMRLLIESKKLEARS